MKPSQTEVLAPSTDNLLTLTACHPKYSASQRIIVQAELATPTAAPASKPRSPTVETAVPAAPLDQGLGGDSSALPVALAFLAGALAIGALAWFLGRRWKRWPVYLVATPLILVASGSATSTSTATSRRCDRSADRSVRDAVGRSPPCPDAPMAAPSLAMARRRMLGRRRGRRRRRRRPPRPPPPRLPACPTARRHADEGAHGRSVLRHPDRRRPGRRSRRAGSWTAPSPTPTRSTTSWTTPVPR